MQQVSILELFNGSVDELDEMLGSNTPVSHQHEQSTTPIGLIEDAVPRAVSGAKVVVHPKVKIEPTNDSSVAVSHPFVQAAGFFKPSMLLDARGTALQSSDQLISPFKCAAAPMLRCVHEAVCRIAAVALPSARGACTQHIAVPNARKPPLSRGMLWGLFC